MKRLLRSVGAIKPKKRKPLIPHPVDSDWVRTRVDSKSNDIKVLRTKTPNLSSNVMVLREMLAILAEESNQEVVEHCRLVIRDAIRISEALSGAKLIFGEKEDWEKISCHEYKIRANEFPDLTDVNIPNFPEVRKVLQENYKWETSKTHLWLSEDFTLIENIDPAIRVLRSSFLEALDDLLSSPIDKAAHDIAPS